MKFTKIFITFFSFLFLCSFDWKEKSITLTVPFNVGGPSDVIARHIEIAIEKNSNFGIAVINQGGASGMIGIRSFLEKNKGLLLTTENIFTNKKYYSKIYPENILNQITPIYFFQNSPYIVYAHNRFDDFDSLVQESNKREILVGTGAPGSGSYESYDLLCNQKKILKMCRRVGYKSGGEATLDLISGRLDMFNSLYSAYHTFTHSNSVKALLVLSKKRTTFLPNIPSSYELGYLVENDNWHGLFHRGLTQSEIEIVISSLEKYFDSGKLNLLGYEESEDQNKFWNEQLKKYRNE